MSEEVIRVEDLRAYYTMPNNVYVRAVDGVMLKVYRGEILGIAGESGCGKSTLLRAMYGLIEYPLKVLGGSVLLLTKDEKKFDMTSLGIDRLRKGVWWRYISFIPQNAQNVLNPMIRVKDHFIETGKNLGMDEDEILERMNYWIDSLGLSRDVASAFPIQLSGGMRQRIVIALAALLEPEVLLADEPTSALDVVNQRVFVASLSKLHKKLRNTVIYVSHDLELLGIFTHRIAVMYAGKIVEVGKTDEVFEKPLHPYSKALIDSIPKIGDTRIRKGLSGRPPDLRNPPPGCRFYPRCPYATNRCRSEEPPLVEVSKGHYVACWLHAKR